MTTETILITGAGSGLGKLTALVLAKIGRNVIATTETEEHAELLKEDAKALKIPMLVEKIDITDPKDREKAWNWSVDILVNNAAVKEGGALVDIPEENFRMQYEVNVFGTHLLTQGFARKMIEKKRGRIVFISSISGLMVNPFFGPYSSTKFATEAMANTLAQELQEFGIEVTTVNPGPFQTGFNDREFMTWRTWQDDPAERIFNYEQLAFPFPQLDPKKAVAPIVRVILGEQKSARNIVPKMFIPAIEILQKYKWLKQANWRLGKQHSMVKQAFKMSPGSDGSYMV